MNLVLGPKEERRKNKTEWQGSYGTKALVWKIVACLLQRKEELKVLSNGRRL